MKKAMHSISTISILLTILSISLYYFLDVAAAKPLAITFGTTAYHFSMRLAVGAAFNKLMKNHADYFQKWYQISPLETKLYKWIRVKQWKNKMPSYNKDDFNPKEHSWSEIAQAMCQAELVHEVIILLSFLPLLFSYWFGRFFVFIITSLCAAMFDMAFVIMQRYNRSRIIKFIHR